MSFSRRRVTILTGFGSVALIVLAVTVLQKELMTQYYLFRLRNDSSYLQSILGKPEGTSQGAAVRQYLDIPEGRAALLSALEICQGGRIEEHGCFAEDAHVCVGAPPAARFSACGFRIYNDLP